MSELLASFYGMRTWLKAYFSLSKSEFNGLLILVVLIVVLKLLPYLDAILIARRTGGDLEPNALTELGLKEQEVIDAVDFFPERVENRPKAKPVRRFYFDPNTIGQQEWEALGLSEKQAMAILKYLAKGGKFRKKEDLKKMYTIRPELYQDLAPYVRIATVQENIENNESFHKSNTSFSRPSIRIVALNTADSTALDALKGIGPAFARRILNYRNRLGGFYKKEQLLEVYGLDSSKYEEIKTQVEVDPAQIKKINVNAAGTEDFKNHPYLRYKQINALIQYRKQHGNYSNIADLTKVAILNAETIDRLAPYLIFE